MLRLVTASALLAIISSAAIAQTQPAWETITIDWQTYQDISKEILDGNALTPRQGLMILQYIDMLEKKALAKKAQVVVPPNKEIPKKP